MESIRAVRGKLRDQCHDTILSSTTASPHLIYKPPSINPCPGDSPLCILADNDASLLNIWGRGSSTPQRLNAARDLHKGSSWHTWAYNST